jgi:predicted molibdopterin-dependent oxidoreductase YjgC
VEIGEAEANKLDLADGDAVRVVSPVGEVTTVVRITETLPQGMLFMPISFPDSPVNSLFDMARVGRDGAPDFKACAVRLERMSADG